MHLLVAATLALLAATVVATSSAQAGEGGVSAEELRQTIHRVTE